MKYTVHCPYLSRDEDELNGACSLTMSIEAAYVLREALKHLSENKNCPIRSKEIADSIVKITEEIHTSASSVDVDWSKDIDVYIKKKEK